MSVLVLVIRLCVAAVFLCFSLFTILMVVVEKNGEGMSMLVAAVNTVTFFVIRWIFPSLYTEFNDIILPFMLLPVVMVIVEAAFEWTVLPAIFSALTDLAMAAAMSGLFKVETVKGWLYMISRAGGYLALPIVLVFFAVFLIFRNL